MKFSSAVFFLIIATGLAKDCNNKKSNSKLFCYYSKLTDVDSCKCSHVVLPANSDIKAIDRLRENAKGVKVLITVNEFNQGLVDILKNSKVDGIEVKLKKLDSKNDINDFISTVRSKLGSNLYIALSVPSKSENLAKFYDFKALSKNADVLILETAFLGASSNVTFHPSRLSGLWDMQNTDSVVDLVSGLGAPLSKLVISSPVQAFQFKLQSEEHTAPGSPALEIQSRTRDELCRVMSNGRNWTLERDQDQTGPYIFSGDKWIAFEDATSVDIKAKYARVRGLAGLALKDLSQDGGTKCESTILDAAYNGLSRQARAPRGAVLRSLEREILDTPARPLDSIQVSPYRISRVIDVEGNVNVIRQDTRTEFECSRQGYFVHPRSCGRFYRCVKFDQLSDEFSVFEFDCPEGLVFDNSVEVCVWPGSLSHGSRCAGSSEIAPVPRERFVCPQEQGYYADPENCRWFFACLDHGKSPLSAYEFRCPFGLVFDQGRLLCEWPWLVPKCGSGLAVGSEVVYGGAGIVGLNRYDGLGVLQTTPLGGLHGPLSQPVAKVYSNVGAIGVSGTGFGGNVENQQYYQTQGGYGNYGYNANSGLSYKAAQSLENAGLLRTGNEGGVNYAQYNTGDSTYGLKSGALGVNYVQGSAGNGGGVNYAQYNTYGLKSGALGVNYVQGSAANEGGVNYAQYNTGDSTYGLKSGAVGVNYVQGSAGNEGGVNYAQYNTGDSTYGLKSGVNYVQGSAGGAYYTNGLNYVQGQTYGGQGFTQYQNGGANLINTAINQGTAALDVQQNYINDNVGTTNAQLVNGLVYDNGAKSKQSFVQYNSETGTAGNINIIGGGYSAVGVVDSGIEISNNGEDTKTITHVTQSPIAVSTVTSIPIVTSVPLPNIKVASGFESYKGGVVANVPELQYKVQRPVGDIGVANISTSFVNVISSTPGYDYPKPTVQLVEQPVVSTTPVAVLSTGYDYPKPVVRFEETPVQIQYNQERGGSFSYHNADLIQQTQGYSYPKPATAFVEVPVRSVTPRPTVKEVFTSFQGYDYPKPAVAFEERPKLSYIPPSTTIRPVTFVQPVINVQPTIQTVQQPEVKQAISFANVQKQESFQGYDYRKPAIVFEEEPQIQVTPKPVAIQTGYDYPKPAVAFEERPQVQVTSYIPVTTVKPVIFAQPAVQTVVQPEIKQAISFSNLQKQENFQGYEYQKPEVVFEEKPLVHVTSYNVPSTTFKPVTPVPPAVQTFVQPAFESFRGYNYPKPTVVFEERPRIQVTTARPVVVQPQVQVGYNYPKPAVAFEEVPKVQVTYIPSTTIRPAVNVQTVTQPEIKQATSFSTFQKQEGFQGYEYQRPAVVFEEKPQVQVTSFNVPSTTVRPVTVVQPVVQSFVQPETKQGVSFASFQKHDTFQGYEYQKPAVVFEERPQVQLTYNVPSTTLKPVTLVQPAVQPVQTFVQPQIKQAVSFETFQGYDYPKPEVVFEERPQIQVTTARPVVQQVQVGYHYQKPAVAFEERPVVVSSTPATILSYNYQKPVVTTYQRPATTYTYKNILQGYSYPQQTPVVTKVQKPAVVSSYSYTTPVKQAVPVQKVEFTGYDYPKPAVQFAEEPVPVQEEQFVKKTAYVTGGQSNSYQYTQNFQKPAIVESYQAPVQLVSTTQKYNVDSGYIYEKPKVEFQEVPVRFSQAVDTSRSYYYNNAGAVSSTATPIVDYHYIEATPKPTFASVVKEVVQAKQPFVYYDSRLSSTPIPFAKVYTPVSTVETVTTSRPIVRYSFSSLDEQYQSRDYLPPVAVTTNEYLPPVTSAPRIKYLPPVTTVRNDYLPPKRVRVKVTTPEPFVVPEVTREYLPSKVTAVPTREYLPVTTPRVVVENYVAPIEMSTVRNDYLPPKRVRVKVTTTPEPFVVPEVTREYLPSKVTVVPTREYLPVTTPRVVVENYVAPIEVTNVRNDYLPPKRVRVKVTTPEPQVTREYLPAKIVKVVRPKTIVKVNDFHSLLAAKLGAQCTCVSNSVKLRKKPLRIIVDDDDDGYAVDQNDNGVVLENYEYEPRKLVEIIPTPQVVVSTAGVDEYPSIPISRKRVRVRPLTTSTIAYDDDDEEEKPSDREIVKAVKTGLKLVKQAAKEGAREGTKEALSTPALDRYGSGGWRGRDETLQGTIDCQREGLFRHPTQCNKFYACRWDCTKKRYTLHVFNCPVHLTFDNTLGACNWPSQGPACLENTLLPSD